MGCAMMARVLALCPLANEFSDLQLGERNPLLHPFQLGTSAAGSREHWGKHDISLMLSKTGSSLNVVQTFAFKVPVGDLFSPSV